eukprot:216014-Prymnesium_polylepis.2
MSRAHRIARWALDDERAVVAGAACHHLAHEKCVVDRHFSPKPAQTLASTADTTPEWKRALAMFPNRLARAHTHTHTHTHT